MTATTSRTWLITGASSGLGRALAETALERGDRVAATVRDQHSLETLAALHGERLLSLVADVRDHDAVAGAVEAAVTGLGGIDVVVNNAGYALGGAVEELSDAEWQAQLSVNLLGTAAVLRAALPHLRRQGAGHVINISSVGGIVGMAGSGAYNASKFALEGLTEALAAELEPLGIRVTAVEPGNLRTDFAGRSIAWTAQHIGDYDDTAGRLRTGLAGLDGHQAGDPARAAAAIVAAIDDERPPRHLLLGTDAIEIAERALRERLDELARWRQAVGIAYAPDDATPRTAVARDQPPGTRAARRGRPALAGSAVDLDLARAALEDPVARPVGRDQAQHEEQGDRREHGRRPQRLAPCPPVTRPPSLPGRRPEQLADDGFLEPEASRQRERLGDDPS